MKNFKIILTLVALLVACNKGTDPKKDYGDVKTVAGKGAASETLDVGMSPFTFRMITTSDIGYATFTAGVKGGTVEIEITPKAQVKEYEAVAAIKPDGSAFVRKGNSNIWALKWDPDINETASRVALQIRAVVKDSAEPRQIGLGGESEKFIINVDKQTNQPQITGIVGLKSTNGQIPTLTMGETGKEFTVEVVDPLSSPQNPPQLVDNGCQTGNNREAPKEVARNFVRPVSATGIPGTHKFHYKYELNLDPRWLREGMNPEGFELCFQFQVFAPGNRSSEVRSQNVRVLTEPAKPQIVMPTGTRNVLLGKSFDMSIDVVVPGREDGKLELTTTELTPENFPGEASLEDTTATSRHAGRKNAASKIFHWDVATNPEALGKEYTLKVEAKHIVTRNGVELPPQTATSILKFKVVDKNVVGTPRTTPRATQAGAK